MAGKGKRNRTNEINPFTRVVLTPTEMRILRVLSDGKKHTRAELLPCLWDEQSTPNAFNKAIHYLRKKLNQSRQDIACEKSGFKAFTYRHVILLPQHGE
jgi:DNA-binding response OmpR family regulator